MTNFSGVSLNWLWSVVSLRYWHWGKCPQGCLQSFPHKQQLEEKEGWGLLALEVFWHALKFVLISVTCNIFLMAKYTVFSTNCYNNIGAACQSL